jgi:hypothetical protein
MDDKKLKQDAISAWMMTKGLTDIETGYSDRLDWYRWRSYRKPSVTLWMTENCFDDHAAAQIVGFLEFRRIHLVLERAPDMVTLIKNDELGDPSVEQLLELPKDIIISSR